MHADLPMGLPTECRCELPTDYCPGPEYYLRTVAPGYYLWTVACSIYGLLLPTDSYSIDKLPKSTLHTNFFSWEIHR